MTVNLNPTNGTLSSRLFENRDMGPDPGLFFDIEITLAPFEYDGELQQTSARLDFIHFDVGHWRELAGKAFTFPRNPIDGYIDASVYLAHVHNPMDVDSIHFGPLDGNSVRIHVRGEVDFLHEGPEDLGRVGVAWDVPLTFDADALDTVYAQWLRRT